VGIAKCCSHLGYFDESRLLELKKKVPQPPPILSPEQIRDYKEANQARVEVARFLVNCFIGATREVPVTAGFQGLDEKPVMRAEEVREMLRVGKNTLYDWCQRNIIPHKRVGRLVFFSRKRIKEWLENEHGGGNQQ
jgi:excisionase family DNA binding protein